MASVNKVIILGNLGRDPEVKHTASGETVCNLSIATTEAWKDKSTGERKEATEWHRVVFFGRVAEVAAQYLRKGSQVYVEGKLTTKKWTDQNGQDRYTTQIQGHELKMLGGKDQGGGAQDRPVQQPQPAPQSSHAPAGGSWNNFTDDIPF